MSSLISTDRLLSLSCFAGFLLFRKYKLNHPNLPTPDLLNVINSLEVDALALDMEASIYLSELVEAECPLDGHDFYQSCIKSVLLKHQPKWARQMRQGRRRFFENLNPNDRDVFTAAGLMIEPPPPNVVTWWDAISGFTRLVTDQAKMEQGRAAEILTIDHERCRLKRIGIRQKPKWPGLDDNYAGYDVLSYDQGSSGITNLLIEVKSTMVSPLRFIVTRNEWNQAERAGKAYIFHVWDMAHQPKPKLHQRTVADIAPHVPQDNGKGSWISATIPI